MSVFKLLVIKREFKSNLRRTKIGLMASAAMADAIENADATGEATTSNAAKNA